MLVSKKIFSLVVFLALAAVAVLPGPLRAQEVKKKVLEEIIARVNNDIITTADYEQAHAAVLQEVQQDCPGCTPAKIQEMTAEREKNLLRDLIDNRLLIQKGKEQGYNVEPDVIKQMDRIRQQNNLEDLEALCRAVEATGITCEDWKANIRNGLLTQEVIRREVGPTLDLGKDEVQAYYDAHKDEFVRPEQVYLFEIFVSTEGKPESEIPELEKKANNLLNRVRNGGEDFEEMAKRYSDGSTAARGGELGMFQRGQLSPELEEIAFKMNRGDISDVIRTKTGFLILKCGERFEEGLQPVDKVENEIMNRLYTEKMQPGLRAYLDKLREESYVLIKPGYVDSAGVTSQPIIEVERAAEDGNGKDKDKKKNDKKSNE